MKDLKDFKIERTLFHLGIDTSVKEVWKYAHNNIQKSVGNEAAESTSKIASKHTNLKDRKFIAYHHYHPELLQHFTKNNDKTMDFLPISLVEKLGLINNGYTNDDLFRGYVEKLKRLGEDAAYVPVPSYKHAEDDLERLLDRIQLNEVVRTCRDKYRGYKALSTVRGDRLYNHVINQRRKLLSDNISEVERAVSILADRVEELELKKRKLEEALKEKEEACIPAPEKPMELPIFDADNHPGGFTLFR